MKALKPDDPRYTSYLLGELPPKEALLVEEQLKQKLMQFVTEKMYTSLG